MRIQILSETTQMFDACLVIELGDRRILTDPGLRQAASPSELLGLKEDGDVDASILLLAVQQTTLYLLPLGVKVPDYL